VVVFEALHRMAYNHAMGFERAKWRIDHYISNERDDLGLFENVFEVE
jgi:hypothetical protein